MRSSVFLKLLAVFLLVILVSTLLLDFGIRGVWRDSLMQEIRRGLTTNARQFAQSVASIVGEPKSFPQNYPQLEELVKQHAQAAQARVTVIAADGLVLADSEADPRQMENHATRPEFAEALHGKRGESIRHSATIGVDFLYVALPVKFGAIRLAYPLSSIEQTLAQVRRTIIYYSLLSALVGVLLAALISYSVSRRIQRISAFADQIAAGDLSARIAERSGDELARLASALDLTAHNLEKSFADLQESREQLETLLNSMQEPVLAVSAEQRVRWANGPMKLLVPGSFKLDGPLVEAVRDPELLTAVQETLEEHSARSVTAHLIAPGRIFKVTVAPMGIGAAVAVLHEITEIERVEKTRRDFIANVSHELRTPLTSIQGYTETLLESATEPTQREFLEILRKNAVRMSRLTEDLLALARVESGEEEFRLKPVASSMLLTDAQESFAERARHCGHKLVVSNTALKPVQADMDKIHQVFANLLDNAMKYSAPGTDIELGACDVEGGVEFWVNDSGHGIPSEHLPRIFERFYRVDKARSIESGGTGLGLAIVKHIVLKHGGNVKAESELNHGSRFSFILPPAPSTP